MLRTTVKERNFFALSTPEMYSNIGYIVLEKTSKYSTYGHLYWEVCMVGRLEVETRQLRGMESCILQAT